MESRRFERWELLDNFLEVTDTVPQMFYSTVKHFGDRPANIYKDGEEWKELNYKGWAKVSEEIAHGLLSLGVEKGTANCIIAHTCAQWAWSDIGNQLAGGVTVTIFPTLSDDEIMYILTHSKVNYVFAGDKELLERVQALWDKVPTIKGIICFDKSFTGDKVKTWNLQQLIDLGRDYQVENPDLLQECINTITANDPATVIYTSGTTGKLKPALFSHKDCVVAAWRGLKINTIGGTPLTYENTVYLSVMPLAHVMERTYGYFCVIANGGTIGFGQSPSTILPDLQVIKPTLFVWVPRLYERILKGMEISFSGTPEGKELWNWAMDVGSRMVDARTSPTGLIDMTIDPVTELTGQLKEDYIKARELVYSKVHAALGGRIVLLACGGASLHPNLHRAFMGMGFAMVNGYGLTETMCNLTISYSNAIKIGWNAEPGPGFDFKVDDDGELLVKGMGIITEYYNDPESTASDFTEDGYFHTGDIVEFDENGYFHIVDRKKSIVVMDTGKNVAPLRIEAKLLSDMVIEQALIIGDGRKYITAIIVPYWDGVISKFKENKIPFDESQLVYEEINGTQSCVEVGSDLATHPGIVSLVQNVVDQANSELSDFETVKNFYISPRKFTQSRDELTPTQKPKNRVIVKNFAEEIEALYA
ncbi:MAG TPA: long-chain fatty acid--CoA ligase [Syntrophomonadaceae bacterium]|nr:long-chain fatty acid--CoA ligase [Syntrophomonadaceae bacterium]